MSANDIGYIIIGKSATAAEVTRLLQEVSSAASHADAAAIISNFDFGALDADEREALKEQLTDILSELPETA